MSDSRPKPPPTAAVGIDFGGSSAKGALVDVSRGVIVGDRWTVPVSRETNLDALARSVREQLAGTAPEHPVGITYPGVVEGGRTHTAANVHPDWCDQPLASIFAERFGREVTVLNDADAAGLAEMRQGASRGVGGTVLVLTLGTGIGSALFHDGVLVPNTELGHLEVEGREAETRAAARVLSREGTTIQGWAGELSRVLRAYHALLRPSLFILCGGVTERSREFLPLLEVPAPVRVGSFGADAGIVGAAYAAAMPRTAEGIGPLPR
jgi:polyphosphate glucokinase